MFNGSMITSTMSTVTMMAALGLVGGCAWPKPAAPPSCEAPCGAFMGTSPKDDAVEVKVGLKLQPSTRLHNAALTAGASPGCKSGVPVSQVSLGEDSDARQFAEGPAALPASALVTLQFPRPDENGPSPGLTAPLSVDLDLRAPGGARCLRVVIPEGLDQHLLLWTFGPDE